MAGGSLVSIFGPFAALIWRCSRIYQRGPFSAVALVSCAGESPRRSSVALEAGANAPSARVFIGSVLFAAEIADTPALRLKGLATGDSLAANSGILFRFSDGDVGADGMRGMRFPLDFVWTSADSRMVDVHESVPHPAPMTPDAELSVITPRLPEIYIFEINASEAERQGIRVDYAARFMDLGRTGDTPVTTRTERLRRQHKRRGHWSIARL